MDVELSGEIHNDKEEIIKRNQIKISKLAKKIYSAYTMQIFVSTTRCNPCLCFLIYQVTSKCSLNLSGCLFVVLQILHHIYDTIGTLHFLSQKTHYRTRVPQPALGYSVKEILAPRNRITLCNFILKKQILPFRALCYS